MTSSEARRVHDALKEAIGACLHAALAAKQREERERKDPERRAELMRKEYPEPGAGKGKEKGKEKPAPVPASVVKGWTIAKNTLRVDVAASGRPPVAPAAGEPPEKKSPPPRRGKRKAPAGGSSKDVDDGEENAAVGAVELAIDPNATEGEESEDPMVVAAQVAAAAALLGDCVMPYASNPTVADTFL